MSRDGNFVYFNEVQNKEIGWIECTYEPKK